MIATSLNTREFWSEEVIVCYFTAFKCFCHNYKFKCLPGEIAELICLEAAYI